MIDDLDFVILKINGIDATQLPYNDAASMFLKCDTKVINLEVCRLQKSGICGDDGGSKDVTKSKSNTMPSLSLKSSTSLDAITRSSSPNDELTICNDYMNTENKLIMKFINSQMLVNNNPNNYPIKSKTPVKKPPIVIAHPKATQTDNDGIIYDLSEKITNEVTEQIIEQEHNLFEQCLAPEIDIEEITLRKSNSNESLGLSVCYSGCNGSNSNNCTPQNSEDNDISCEVFVADIHPDSVAGRDGRLRQGDQILQINGKDLKNKGDTESLIAENNNAVTLLVSRYIFTDEDDFNDPMLVEEEYDDVEDDCDDGCENDEDEDFYGSNQDYQNYFLRNLDSVNVKRVLNAAVETNEGDNKVSNITPLTTITKSSITHINPKHPLEISTNIKHDSIYKNILENTESLSEISKDTTSNIQHEKFKNFNTELQSKSTIDAVVLKCKKKDQVKLSCNNSYDSEHIYETIPEDSESEPFYCSPYEESSAYVTAVGSGDALHLQQHKQRVAQWLGEKRHMDATQAVTISLPTKSKIFSSNIGLISTGYTDQNGDVLLDRKCDDRVGISAASHNTDFTYSAVFDQQNQYSPKASNRVQENVEQSLLQQPNLFYRSHGKQKQKIGSEKLPIMHQTINTCPQFTAPNLSQYHFVSSQEVTSANLPTIATVTEDCGTKSVTVHDNFKDVIPMVWKVKRRPDGTRYIVRRPAVRNRIIQGHSDRYNIVERFNKDIPTTEDDTISEVKIGKYWSKEDRKRHIERARERRQQHTNNINQQNADQTMTANNLMSTLRISDKSDENAIKTQAQNAGDKCNSYRSYRQQASKLIQPHQRHQQQKHVLINNKNHYHLQFNNARKSHKPYMQTNENKLKYYHTQNHSTNSNNTANIFHTKEIVASCITSTPTTMTNTTKSLQSTITGTVTPPFCMDIISKDSAIAQNAQNTPNTNDANKINNLLLV